jgi:uncharacterized protein
MMKQTRVYSLGAVMLVGLGIGADMIHAKTTQNTTVGFVDPMTVALQPAPINKEWILEGRPQTFAKQIARSDDGSQDVFVWQTSAGRFNWFYGMDEVVTVIDGAVYVTDQNTKVERRLGPGDTAFFPAGSKAVWRVPDHVRKVATMNHILPGPMASAIRILRRLKNWAQPSEAFAAS